MMPVDTSIYQNLLRAPKSVADYDAEWQGQQANALTLQKARNALAMQSQEMEAAQRSAQEAGAWNNALRGVDLNTPEGRAQVMRTDATRAIPLLTSHAKLQDQYAETRGRDAAAMKTMADAVSKKLDMQRDQLRFVQSPQQAAAWMQAAYADPELGPIVQRLGPIEQLVQSIPQDPQGLQNWVLQASEGAAKLRERVNAEAMQGETVRRNKAAEGIQIRGQNMADARQRDALKQADQHFNTRRADDAKKDAAGGKAGNATEGERKAATLLARLRGSQAQLTEALATTPDAAKPNIKAEILRNMPLIGNDTAANLVTPEARQQVEAAQLDILDAALTLGTGAAYTREQLQGYRKSYFPQIGDDAKTVKDKQARLQNVIQAAEIAAGRAATPAAGNDWEMPGLSDIDAELARRKKGK